MNEDEKKDLRTRTRVFALWSIRLFSSFSITGWNFLGMLQLSLRQDWRTSAEQ